MANFVIASREAKPKVRGNPAQMGAEGAPLD